MQEKASSPVDLNVSCSDDPSDFDSVQTVVSAGTDFCSYTTFGFLSTDVEVEPGVSVPPSAALIDPASREAIRAELAERGLTETNTDPDISINLFFRVSNEQFDTTQCGWWAGGGFTYACGDFTVTDVPVGAEVIDLVDRVGDNPFLRGLIQGILRGEGDTSRLNELVSAVFDPYPSLTICP